MNTSIAYLSAEGFEQELRAELADSVIAEYGRIFVADPAKPRRLELPEPAWSVNTWLEPVELSVRSISDAATQLRAIGKLWSLDSFQNHRRAVLVQESLPKLRSHEMEFLGALPDRDLGGWAMISDNRVLASAKTTSPFESGLVKFVETKSAPSRAYLKLWELFTIHGVRPKAGDKCIDLGACPGGWTYVLAKLGCEVMGVDRTELDPAVMKMKGVSFRKGNAFTLKPIDVGAIDWLFSDVICFPAQLLDLIETWLASGLCRNMVCTVKLKGETDFEVCQKLAKIPGSKLKHLSCNKHELTWWLVRE